MIKFIYGLIVISAFYAGTYLWRVTQEEARQQDRIASQKFADQVDGLVVIGNRLIKKSDLDFEYEFHTKDLDDHESLTPIPELRESQEEGLTHLRDTLLADIIERNILIEQITKDKNFNSKDEDIQKSCDQETEEVIKNYPDFASRRKTLNRFLCQVAIISRYTEKHLFINVAVTDEEVREFYEKNIEKYKSPRKIRLRQIVLKDERTAKRVIAKTRRANFALRAREHSITPEGKSGGLIPAFAKGEMPPVFDMAFRMRTGQISQIQKSPWGFHIFLLERKIKPKTLALSEVAPRIRRILLSQQREEVYRKWVEMASNNIRVSIPRL